MESKSLRICWNVSLTILSRSILRVMSHDALVQEVTSILLLSAISSEFIFVKAIFITPILI